MSTIPFDRVAVANAVAAVPTVKPAPIGGVILTLGVIKYPFPFSVISILDIVPDAESTAVEAALTFT